MASESSRHPSDERILPADTDPPGPGPSSDAGGETLAEKIHRYRQMGLGGSDGAPALGGRVAPDPGEE